MEAIETPESILLSTVSGEQSKDRTDREIVTPWLKFLWETYRTVLDILKNNSRLEIMYQSTAREAFQFCSKYARKTEFRRLCELLRNHLQNAAKYSAQMHGINLNDPDTLQRHLETRFHQLNVAVELELWQEAFRSTEDIHTLLNLSRRPAKNVVMANYFEKLARIFLVSDNFLFHAASWNRYYNLLGHSVVAIQSGQPKKDNPVVAEGTVQNAASFVLLSALSIPVISTQRSRGALVDVDEAKKNKNARLTNLLGMSQPPTRSGLLKDALNKGLLKRVRPEIRELYNILEVEFHPLSICKRISPILKQIGANPDMQKYVIPLQQVILTRLFQQLSQVYDSVDINFVLNLAQFPEPFEVNRGTIEKFIMNGCKKGDLAIRVDHASGILTFDSDIFSSAKALHPGAASGSAESDSGSVQRLQSTPAEIVRSTITRLAKTLYVTCQYVDPTFNESRQQAKAAAFARAAAGAEEERQTTLARRQVIEKRKSEASNALAQKEKDEAAKKAIRAQQAQKAEALRLAEEQREREKKRLQAEQERIKREEIEKQLKELQQGSKINIEIPEDLTELDSTRIRALKLQALEKEKNQLGDQLRITGKRIDHIERAYRREEVKHLQKDYDAQLEADKAAYEKAKKETLTEAKEKHTEAVALKHRLSRLVPQYQGYVNTVREQRKAEFEKRKKAAEKEFQAKKQARVKEVRERRAREKREEEEAERQAREEEERARVEEEERARVEEERRQRMLEEKEKREEERKKLDEIAERQRQREAEAEARRAERKTGGAAAPPARAEPVAASAGGPPRLALAGSKPSWREREAAKAAGGATAAESSAPAAEAPASEAAPARSGYVPPALRNRDGAGAAPSGWRGREGSGRGPREDDRSRNESPAQRGASGRYAAPGARSESPATGTGGPGRYAPPGRRAGGPSEPKDSAPLPPAAGGSDGKYRPGMFKARKDPQ